MPASLRLQANAFEAVLNALSGGAATYFGDPNAALYPVLRVDRPFSCVLRLRVRTTAGETHAFVKIFKSNGFAPEEIAERRRLLDNEYRTALHLYEMCASQPGLTALRPVAVFPDHLAIVTAEVPGEPLDRILRGTVWGLRPPSTAINAAARVGAWIAAYQKLPPHGGATVGREYVDVRLRALVGTVLTAEDREFALAVYDTLEGLDSVAARTRVAIHGDLCAANIIVQQTGEVTVIDFSTAKAGTRFHDVAHLYVHLENEAMRMPLRRRLLTNVERALLAGFDPAAHPGEPLFRLMLLQHSACHLALLAQHADGSRRRLHALRRRWQHLMPLWCP